MWLVESLILWLSHGDYDSGKFSTPSILGFWFLKLKLFNFYLRMNEWPIGSQFFIGADLLGGMCQWLIGGWILIGGTVWQSWNVAVSFNSQRSNLWGVVRGECFTLYSFYTSEKAECFRCGVKHRSDNMRWWECCKACFCVAIDGSGCLWCNDNLYITLCEMKSGDAVTVWIMLL